MPAAPRTCARAAPVVVVLHAAADVERRRHVVAHVVEEPDRQVGKNIHVFAMSYETARPPSLPMMTWFGVRPDRSRSRARRRGSAAATSVAIVLPPSSVWWRPTPPRYTTSGSFGSMRTWLKYIGRGLALLTFRHVAPRRRSDRGRSAGCSAPAPPPPPPPPALRAPPRPRRRAASSPPPPHRRRRDRPARRRAFDQRVEDVRTLAIDVEGDAAERSVGKPVLQPRPGLAAVGRLPDAAARAAAVHAARRAPALVGRGVEDLAVRRIDREIVGAGVVVDLQHLLPGLAAVGRLVDAALAAGPEQRAGGGDEHRVVVARIDDDAVDVPRGARPMCV